MVDLLFVSYEPQFTISARLLSQLGVSRQGAMNLLRPLLEAGLVEKIGGKKTGRYALRQP